MPALVGWRGHSVPLVCRGWHVRVRAWTLGISRGLAWSEGRRPAGRSGGMGAFGLRGRQNHPRKLLPDFSPGSLLSPKRLGLHELAHHEVIEIREGTVNHHSRKRTKTKLHERTQSR